MRMRNIGFNINIAVTRKQVARRDGSGSFAFFVATSVPLVGETQAFSANHSQARRLSDEKPHYRRTTAEKGQRG